MIGSTPVWETKLRNDGIHENLAGANWPDIGAYLAEIV